MKKKRFSCTHPSLSELIYIFCVSAFLATKFVTLHYDHWKNVLWAFPMSNVFLTVWKCMLKIACIQVQRAEFRFWKKNVLSKNFMQCKNAAKFFKINLYIVLYISEFHQVMCINLHFDYWKKFFRKFPVQPCLWNWTFALKNCVSCCEVCQMNFYVWKMLVKITCSHVVQSFT